MLNTNNVIGTLEQREIHGEPKVFKDKAENLSKYVSGGKNWGAYEQGEIAFGAIAANKIKFTKDYTITKDTGLLNLNEKQLANESIKTLLIDETDVQTLADGIADLYEIQRYFYTIETHRNINIGDKFIVTYQGKGLSGGKELVCFGREFTLGNNIKKYTFWG